MKRMLVVFIALLSLPLTAEGLKTVNQTENLAEKLVTMFYAKDFKGGIDAARPYWPLPQSELDGLTTTIISQWVVVENRFGEATGYELIKKEKIGSSFIRYYYLHKFERHAIYWNITFYRPEDLWVINTISFMDDLEILFEPAE